jgi:hypothetical protein
MKIHKIAILKCEKIYILKTKSCRLFSFGSQAICKSDPAALRPCLAEARSFSRALQSMQRSLYRFALSIYQFYFIFVVISKFVPNTVGFLKMIQIPNQSEKRLKRKIT